MDSEPLNVVAIGADGQSLARRVAELMQERDAALVTASAERNRSAVAMRQCEHLASEIFAERRRHARDQTAAAEESRQLALQLGAAGEESGQLALRLMAAEEESRQLAFQLAHALQTIRNMERSWFWRMRLVWVRIRSLIP